MLDGCGQAGFRGQGTRKAAHAPASVNTAEWKPPALAVTIRWSTKEAIMVGDDTVPSTPWPNCPHCTPTHAKAAPHHDTNTHQCAQCTQH